MATLKTRGLAALLMALTLGLLVGSQAFAAAPPTLYVSEIGHGTVSGAGGVISCGSGHTNCVSSFGADATPNIAATAAGGWTFAGWDDPSGTCTGTTTPCQADVTAAGNPNVLTALFTTTSAVASTTLTTSVTSDGTTQEGRVQGFATNYPIDCGNDGVNPATSNCSLTVVAGSTITLAETPNSAGPYVFKGWGGSCTSTHDSCSVYMAGNRSVSADFVGAGTSTLTVNVSGAGTVNGGGLSCTSGATCTAEEPTNGTYTLTATAASGYAFTGWSDDCSGTQNTCSVDMSAPREVTATFSPVIPIELTVNGAGTVSGSGITCGPGPTTCSGSGAPDSTVEFTATPTTVGGSVSWIGCTTASGTLCTVEVGTDPVAVTATFSGSTTGGGGSGSFVQLTVSVTGNGYVSSTNPAIWCTAAGGSGCTATVQQNTSVQLHAVSASGSTTDFTNWTGSCSTSLSTICTVLMSSAKSVGATFAGSNTTFALSGSVSGGGTINGGGLTCSTPGGIGCASPEPAGARITLTATPSASSDFTGWSGACTGSASTCSVQMSSAESVTATFTASSSGGGGGSSTDALAVTVTGGGTVAAGSTKCASTGTKTKKCTSSVLDGASVELKATPNKGYKFAGWKGACTGTKPTCTVTPNADVSVTATFKELPIAAAAKKPAIAKLSTGYRVTISFVVGEAGKVTVTTKPKTTKLTKTVKTGANIVRLTVKKRGLYTFTVSLRSKSGTHALHYKIKV